MCLFSLRVGLQARSATFERISFLQESVDIVLRTAPRSRLSTRDVAWFPNKRNLYKYHQENKGYSILQQDQGLLDRIFRVSIRWRKTAANQLELDLLSSPVLLSTARRVLP